MAKKDRTKSLRRWGIAIIVLVALIALFFVLSGFLTDLIWFGKVGYISVFMTEIMTKLKIGVPGFLIFSAIGYLVLLTLKRSFLKKNEFELAAGDKGKIRKSMLAISAVPFAPDNCSEAVRASGARIVRACEAGALAHVIEILNRRYEKGSAAG